jgi:endoglucanase
MRCLVVAALVASSGCDDVELPVAPNDTDSTRFNTLATTAASIFVRSGNRQEMIVGCPVSKPVKFKVVDANGQPVVGETVRFRTRNGATARPARVQTTTEGIARTIWRLGTVAGVDTLIAELPNGLTAVATADARAIAPGGYGTIGRRVYRYDCVTHRFTGVNRPALQWTSTPNLTQPHFAEISQWRPNIVRLNLSQGFWVAGSASYDPNYPMRVDSAIKWAHNWGMDVILDLHYSDRGDLSMPMAMGQRMPDRNSVTFWREVAQRYKNDGRVLFDLYNEPHDVSWSVWRNGGPTGDNFDAVGMQTLYATIRSTGAHNLVIAAGLNWGYDLSGLPQYALNGYNIMYSSHPYSYANKQPDDWNRAFLKAAARYPVLLGEFGTYDCSRPYVQQLLDVADQNGLHWTAWAFYIEDSWTLEKICSFPSLIIDWHGTASPMGEVVRDRLLSY